MRYLERMGVDMSEPDLSARSALLLGFATLLILIGGIGAWSATTPITGAIVAPGVVQSERVSHILQHPDGGVVTTVLVSEGDLVREGDVLLQLDSGLHRSRLAVLQAQQADTAARIARLSAERDGKTVVEYPHHLSAMARTNSTIADMMSGQSRLFALRNNLMRTQTAQLNERIMQIAQQKRGLAAQRTAVEAQLALLRDDLGRQKEMLSQGLAQYPRITALEREDAILSGRLAEIAASEAEADMRLAEAQLGLLSFQADRMERITAELHKHRTLALEQTEQVRSIERDIARQTLHAPMSGIVHDLQVHTPQTVVSPGKALLTIVPRNASPLIVAQIDPAEIEQVFVGQAVTVITPTKAHRGTRDMTGTVAKIPADTIPEGGTNRPIYEIRIRLDEKQTDPTLRQTLRSGMAVTALIQTGARTPISYLLDPLIGFFRTALRET